MHHQSRTDGSHGAFWTMKRTTVLSLIVFEIICLLSGVSRAQQPAKVQRPLGKKKILIVYLSRTNNTKAIAEIIHQKVGGRIVYALADLKAWVNVGIRKSTSDPGSGTVLPAKKILAAGCTRPHRWARSDARSTR